jgi:hypothetical protein
MGGEYDDRGPSRRYVPIEEQAHVSPLLASCAAAGCSEEIVINELFKANVRLLEMLHQAVSMQAAPTIFVRSTEPVRPVESRFTPGIVHATAVIEPKIPARVESQHACTHDFKRAGTDLMGNEMQRCSRCQLVQPYYVVRQNGFCNPSLVNARPR